MAEKKSKKANELDEMSLDELIERCKQMKELLANIENQYRAAAITEQSYKQTKEANIKKLNEVRKRLEEWGIKDEEISAPTAAPAAQKPAASTSAAPAQAPAATATSPSAPATQKTAQVPPPVQALVFSPPQETFETNESAQETPVAAPAPSTPKSFTQKLKQQFMPSSPSQRSPEDPAYISQTVQLELQKFQEKFNIELERIKASIDAMKETRASTDERMHMLTEGIAELRSNVFQREAGIKEQEMRLTKIKEMVDEVEPQKISKEFSRRDKTASDIEVRLEKLEIKTSDLVKTINEINALLKSIGGLENVADVDHAVSKKFEEIREINTATERLSSKIEKIFIDINKRLEKFNIYEARQDNISEIVNDMIRNFDALSLKFESYAEKKDLATSKEDIADVQKKIEELKKTLKRAVPFAEAQIPEEIQALQTEREDIESLLSSIEYEHEKKQISDEEYASIRVKNGARLKEIKKKIAEAMKAAAPADEEKDSAGANAAAAKKQGPSLVDAMSKDMDANKTAAKKTAEESKKKDDAAKKEAEKEKENEEEKKINEDSESDGKSDEGAEETGGEDEEPSEENETEKSQESEEESESADVNEKKEAREKNPSKAKSAAPKIEKTVPEAKTEIVGESEEEQMPEISDEHIERAVAEELRIHQGLSEPESEEIVHAMPAHIANKKPAKKMRATAVKTKRAEHKIMPKAHEAKEKNGPEEIATRMFLRANKIDATQAKSMEKTAPKNIPKKKAAPAKQNKKVAEKHAPALDSRRALVSNAKPAAKKAIAPSRAVRIENRAVAEEKIKTTANNAAVQAPADTKPRKSLRSSQDLFVPAKEIASIKSVMSAGAQSAQMPEKHDTAPEKIAAPVKAVKEDTAKPAKENTNATKVPVQPAKKSEKPEPMAANEAENPLLTELDDSLKQGLISKETYENTKKLLMMG